MHQQFELKVFLKLKAPLISSGGGDAVRGLNRIFYRDAEGRIVLQGSHIKGKLREAFRELKSAGIMSDFNLTQALGRENDTGEWLPENGKLQFTDFILKDINGINQNAPLTRVSINLKTGTSRENFLQFIEKIALPGSSTKWEGGIHFSASSKDEAKVLGNIISIGLKWMTAVGGMKGSGYGILEEVKTSLEECKSPHVISLKSDGGRDLTMIFEFENDLLIGGVKKKSNYLESINVIPGSIIKGALARHLNQVCGSENSNCPINENNISVTGSFPNLSKWYSMISFSHAFPTNGASGQGPIERPVMVPLSAIRTGDGKYYDAALTEEPLIDRNKKSVEFKVDWKNADEMNPEFGWAECGIIHKTRTAINPQTRRASGEQLYTYQYITPYIVENKNQPTNNDSGSRIRVDWMAKVRLPQINDDKQLSQLLGEFIRAVQTGWNCMGKRGSRFRCTIENNQALHKIKQHPKGTSVDGIAIVSLQTDALMFDGRSMAENRSSINLFDVYQRYWKKMTKESCTLLRFFAGQKMLGGYLTKRYQVMQQYYPFVVTEAGSVFVLKVNDLGGSSGIFEDIERYGLPLPEDVLRLIPDQKQPWEVCPFVRENGYGEVCVNLEWHWKHGFGV